MSKMTIPLVSAVILLLGTACAGPPAVRGGGPSAAERASAEQEAVAAAAAAAAVMRNGGGAPGSSEAAPNAGGAPSGVSPVQDGQASSEAAGGGERNRPRPVWVSSPDAVYNRNVYIAQVGNGADRGLAEKDALARLSAYFRQNIQGEQTSSTRYREAIRDGVVDSYSEDTTLINTIRTSLELESLVGAEIADYWFDGGSVHYAVALMEKAKVSVIYADMIRANRELIKALTAMTGEEKYTMDGYARYRLAANIAEVNSIYGNVLSLAGSGGTGIVPDKPEQGADFRLEAANITKNIPVEVRVANDRSSRIASAFSRALGGAGFRTGTRNSPYVLEVKVSFTPVDLPNNQPQYKFVRYVVDANLVEAASGDVLLPYNINGREGHLNISEAENRAAAAAEKKIGAEYENTLNAYLDGLLPLKK
ncbi:MAG: LPP20 family lipoprotein [Treponema sp.]|jgi:hypothetical protein|nr:LPP20 family lipoprotein [Treponema sp.]